MDMALGSMLFAGLSLGMLHAFDPDHLAAVAGITAPNLAASGQKNERLSPPLWTSLQWSFGHGASLLIISVCVLLLGTAIPKNLSDKAEQMVGIVLILIGLSSLWRIFRKWTQQRPPAGFAVAAPMVGLVHGMAGSAPLLAILPLTLTSQPVVSIGYVFLFCLGVVLGMLALSYFMGVIAQKLLKAQHYWVIAMQSALAAFSLVLGLFLLF